MKKDNVVRKPRAAVPPYRKADRPENQQYLRDTPLDKIA